MRPTDTQTHADSSESENVESLRKERNALIQERDSLFDRLARTTADFQNAHGAWKPTRISPSPLPTARSSKVFCP